MALQSIKVLSFFNLLATQRFLPLFITQFLGAFNDNFFKTALVILIAFQDNQIWGLAPKEMVALSAGIFILPFFIFSAFSGILADRLDKIIIARSVKVAEICIVLLASYGFLANHFTLLLICLFLMGLHSTFFGPVKYAILPQHLKSEELLNGNAFVGAGTFIAILLGTVFGGLLISFGKPGLFWVCLVMLAFSIIGLFTAWFIPSAPKSDQASDHKLSFNFYVLSKQVLKLSFENKSIFLSIILFSWFWFVGVAFLSLIPPYVKEVLLGDQKKATLFLSIFTIGITTGAILCSIVSKNKINLKLVPTGGLILSVFSGLIGFFHLYLPNIISIELIGGLFFFACIGGGLYSIPLITYIQHQSKNSERSQIISSCNIINAFAMVISSQLIILFFKFNISIPTIFIIISILNLLAVRLTAQLKP
jgi:acyl-[acyl-carrier-protein]-phospholipid O-acyltransferase/long-chain-fatty-acid--[acyl-carrier-protein] ligase